MVIMDFSGVYEQEKFYTLHDPVIVDMKDIEGTNSYCDEEAAKKIADRITSLSFSDIHFIDNGNYHYITKFWLDKIRQDFSLVVFDNHSDMQPGAFGDVLSCGSWILHVIKENKHLKEIFLVGASAESIAEIPVEYKSRIKIIKNINNVIMTSFPIYLSIDKDVLSENIVKTNWDQGKMTVEELQAFITFLSSRFTVLGVDICGECEPNANVNDIFSNDKVNMDLVYSLTQKTFF